jgi:integrase
MMASDHNIWKSPGGALFFKLGIPPGLRDRPEFRSSRGKPKTKITEPLGTYNPAEAREIRDQKLAHWKRVFARMNAGVPLLAEDIEAEAERIRVETLAAFRAPPPPTYEEEMRIKVAHAEAKVEAMRRFTAAMRATLDEIAAKVAEVAERHGITIEKGTPLYAEVGNAVLDAINRAGDEYEAETVPPAPVAPAAAPLPVPASKGGFERFSQAFEHYIAWLRDKQKVRPATIQDYTTRARRFIEFAKDPSLGAVTIDDAQRFLDEIGKTTSAATVNLHHIVCKAVFEHARNERRKFDGHNPFSFKPRKHRAKSKAKYTVDELNRFLASAVFAERQIKPTKYNVDSALPWVTAIGLFSGLTLEEVCQLRPRDIRAEAGNGLVIYVEREAAVSGELKRPARERTVPLHPALEKLGVLQYLAALPRGSRWIFPGLGDGMDKRSGAVGKAFNRWRRELGIERPGEKLDFHSLRHTFGKAIEDAGIRPNDCARLLGHSVPGITSSIYSGPELKRVAPLVARVKWEGLRLPKAH